MSDKIYEDRICPVCGLTFTPNHKRQIYDKDYCRVKAGRQRQKGDVVPLDSTGLLEEIRKVDVETAADIEDIAKRAGLQIAEEILLVCWRAMNRSAVRQARALLIEAGQLPKARKSSKTASLSSLNAILRSISAVSDLVIEKRSDGYWLCRFVGGVKETKAKLGTLAAAGKWVDETAASGRPNYAKLRV